MTKTLDHAEVAYTAARGVLPAAARVVVIVLDGDGNPSLDFDFDPEFSVHDVRALILEAADQLTGADE